MTRRQLLCCATLGFLPISDRRNGGELLVQIEAGVATVTLAEFIRQTGLQVLFEADALRGHTTRAVRGRLEAREALRVMLEGSGLMFEFINERTVAVRPEPFTRARL